MASTFAPDDSGSTARPDMISGLGILSFVNIGLFTVIYLIGLFAMLGLSSMPEEQFISMLEEQTAQFKDMMPEDQVGAIQEIGTLLYNGGTMLLFLLLLRTVVRGWGVISMWRGKKIGFTIYAVAQVLGIFAPHIIIPLKYLGFFGPLMAMLMVVLYGTQRKRLI